MTGAHGFGGGLCGCAEDPAACCLATVCPTMGSAVVAERLGMGSKWYYCSFMCCMDWFGCCVSTRIRNQAKERAGVPANFLASFAEIVLCMPCAVAQELRATQELEEATVDRRRKYAQVETTGFADTEHL